MAQENEMNGCSGPLQRPFTENRRKYKRRTSAGSTIMDERRSRQERRLDADWRYALIRRRVNG